MNDLDLLRTYEPVVKYTAGERFLPSAVDGYVAGSSLWEVTPSHQRRELVPAGELTVARLAEQEQPAPGHSRYLRFVGEPLGARAYQRWRTEAASPTFHAAGRLTRVGIPSRIISSMFNFSLLVRGAVPGGTAAAADVAVHQMRADDPRHVYYGRVLRQGGYVILHYVYFYAMNDWRSGFYGINDHEADWEQCLIYLVQDTQGEETQGEETQEDVQPLKPLWVAFAAHDYSGDDLRRRWDDPELTLVDGCHPVIYAGAGSHAAYCVRGEYITGVAPQFLMPLHNAVVWLRKFWVEKLAQGDSTSVHEEVHSLFQIAFVDYARGDGMAIGPEQAESWSPILLDGQPWVERYRGLWGVDTEDPLGGERAPAGPKYNRDGSVRLSWYDPLAWAGLDKTPPPQDAPLVLAERLAHLQQERAELEPTIAAKREQVRTLEMQANALQSSQYWQTTLTAQLAALHAAQADLQAQTTHLQSLRESQAACEALAARIARGEQGDPQAHLRRQLRPEPPLPGQSRLLDLWGAVSGAILMVVLLLLMIYAPAQWYVWVVVAVLLALGVESWLRRRLPQYLLNVTIFLAFVSLAVLLVAFWRLALVLAVLLLAAAMTRDNLSELLRR